MMLASGVLAACSADPVANNPAPGPGSRVEVTFIGGEMLSLEYSFAGFSPNRLVLDGFEYQRLA